jgi:hypothetical protein
MSKLSARFWFLTFPAAASAPRSSLVAASQAARDNTYPTRPPAAAVEVVRRDAQCWTLLVSLADSPSSPASLECVFAVSNEPQECDRLASFGVPIVDGEFELAGSTLTVTAAVYGVRTGSGPSTPRREWLLRIDGIDWDAPPGAVRKAPFNPRYRQLQATPDLARPDSEVIGRLLHVAPERTPTCTPDGASAHLTFNSGVLYPDVATIFEEGAPALNVCEGRAGEWRGDDSSPGDPLDHQARFGPGGDGLKRLPRSSAFGEPSFLFERVEIVGFRTELPSKGGRPARDLLRDLIAPLNFHMLTATDSTAPADFRYEAASATIVIELLRYGAMRTRHVPPPFRVDDFMSQHELLARIVVGRVDDDTGQGREAAIFVPTIFVDNPWSKAAGRSLQGFPKVLASFCTPDGPLDMDGCLTGNPGTQEPLHGVNQVHIVKRVGDRSSDTKLLELAYPSGDNGSRGEFQRPPSTSVLDGTLFRRAPWEQLDFDDVEFRRSFARDLIKRRFDGYTSLQVSPVDDGVNLPKAWISGRFNVFDLEVAFPTGVATLQLNVPPAAPAAWKALCEALGDRSEAIGFPTGDWYRLKCSMELEVDDALRW